jgi:hypothetical protein
MPVFIVKKLLYAQKTIEYQILFRKIAPEEVGHNPPLSEPDGKSMIMGAKT